MHRHCRVASLDKKTRLLHRKKLSGVPIGGVMVGLSVEPADLSSKPRRSTARWDRTVRAGACEVGQFRERASSIDRSATRGSATRAWKGREPLDSKQLQTTTE